METRLLNIKGEEKGTVALPEAVFGAKVDPYFLHELVRYYNAAQRVGTASTKTRTEVSGGGRKPWKQKHTGRARQGSIRSPLWRKGGVVFGPKPRDFSLSIPSYKRTLGLIQALSDKFQSKSIIVLENFEIAQPKTSVFADFLSKAQMDGKKVIFVTAQKNDKLALCARNLKGMSVINVSDINAMEVMRNNVIAIEKDALEKLAKRLEVK